MLLDTTSTRADVTHALAGVTGSDSQPRTVDVGWYYMSPVDFPCREALQDFFERDAPVESSEIAAQTEMNAIPEGQVLSVPGQVFDLGEILQPVTTPFAPKTRLLIPTECAGLTNALGVRTPSRALPATGSHIVEWLGSNPLS
jgi:hypothetical protein